MPYDSRTELLGIVARHADDCPVRTGGTCRCGPLGFRGGIWDWETSMWVLGPVLRTAAAAREWQRAAHRDDAWGGAAGDITADRGADDVDPSEQLWWWAFCYVGLGIFALALALTIAGLGS